MARPSRSSRLPRPTALTQFRRLGTPDFATSVRIGFRRHCRRSTRPRFRSDGISSDTYSGTRQRSCRSFTPSLVGHGRLADAIHEIGKAEDRPIDALVQVNVVGEDTKGGFDRASWASEAERLRGLSGVRVRGVMTMAPLDADETVLRTVFSGARDARDVLCAAGHQATELSMGMSNDYEIAVEEGATLVRLGTILFGARPA